MKSTLSLILSAGAIIAVLFFISSTGKKAPNIPLDNIHHTITIQESCVICHAPGKQAPLKDTHPPKEQCLICHKAGNR
jgi:cbb3-type cytochrome oxidase cytochrome c subunit